MGHNHCVSVHVNILESWWHCCGAYIHVTHISGEVHLAVHTQFVGMREELLGLCVLHAVGGPEA